MAKRQSKQGSFTKPQPFVRKIFPRPIFTGKLFPQPVLPKNRSPYKYGTVSPFHSGPYVNFVGATGYRRGGLESLGSGIEYDRSLFGYQDTGLQYGIGNFGYEGVLQYGLGDSGLIAAESRYGLAGSKYAGAKVDPRFSGSKYEAAPKFAPREKKSKYDVAGFGSRLGSYSGGGRQIAPVMPTVAAPVPRRRVVYVRVNENTNNNGNWRNNVGFERRRSNNNNNNNNNNNMDFINSNRNYLP